MSPHTQFDAADSHPKGFSAIRQLQTRSKHEGYDKPLRNIQAGQIDFCVVRENNEGEYSNIGGMMYEGTDQEFVVQETVFTRKGVERIMKYAADHYSQKAEDFLPLSLRSKLHLMELPKAFYQSHFPDDEEPAAQARHRLIFDEFFLLDEMSLGLAPIIVQNIFEVVVQINKTGISILLVEQNVPMTLRIADRAYVMESGRIVKHDEAKTLLNDPYIKETYLFPCQGSATHPISNNSIDTPSHHEDDETPYRNSNSHPG
jgi:hypothetical protein